MVSKYVLALVSLCFFLATPALAATTTAPKATVPVAQTISTVVFKDATVTKKEGRTLDISFSLANGAKAEPQVKYAVVLASEKVGGGPVDTYVYSEVVSLKVGESQQKSVTYTPPASVGGKHTLWLEARTVNGYRLAFTHVDDISIDQAENASVYIDVKSCYLTIGTEGTRYTLRQGIDVLPTEDLRATCSIMNASSKSVVAKPIFKTYYRTEYGPLVATQELASVTLAPNAVQRVTFDVTKSDKPQAYDAVLSFEGADRATSNDAVFHYVLRGSSATIQQASLDKSNYESGEQAVLSLYWTGSADSFAGARLGPGTLLTNPIANIELRDERGTACANVQKVPLSENKLTINIPVTRNCENPEVAISLVTTDAGGKETTLDNQKITTIAPIEGTFPTTVAIVTAILILLAGGSVYFFLYRRNNLTAKSALVIILVAGSAVSALTGLPGRYAAAFVAWEPLQASLEPYSISWESVNYDDNGNYPIMNAFFKTSRDTYTTRQPIRFTTIFSSSDVCANGLIAPVIAYVRIVDPSSRVVWSAQYPSAGSSLDEAISWADRSSVLGFFIDSQRTLPPGYYNAEARFYDTVWASFSEGQEQDQYRTPNVTGSNYSLECTGFRVAERPGCMGKVIVPFRVIEDGVCGSASTVYPTGATSYGSDKACAVGAPHTVGGAPLRGPLPFPPPGATVNWKCSGSESGGAWSPTCSASVAAAPLAGVCGPASKVYPAGSDPYSTDAFCSVGSPVRIDGTRITSIPPPTPGITAQWYCSGVSGGSLSPLCRASIQTEGTCGPAARRYLETETAYSGLLCSSGIAFPPYPFFPAPGQNNQWACVGSLGGDNALCRADRAIDDKPDLIGGVVSRVTAEAGVIDIYPASIENLEGVDTSGSPAGNGGFRNLLLRADQDPSTLRPDLSTVREFSNSATVVANLAANSSMTLDFRGRFDVADAGKTRYLKVCADTTFKSNVGLVNSIIEMDETNNCGPWRAVTVAESETVPACSPLQGTACDPRNACGRQGTINCEGVCMPDTRSCPTDPGEIPEVTIDANPKKVKAYSEDTNISWVATNVDQCDPITRNGSNWVTLSVDGVNKWIRPGGTGARSDRISSKTVYTITCRNGVNVATDSVEVNIWPIFQPF